MNGNGRYRPNMDELFYKSTGSGGGPQVLVPQVPQLKMGSRSELQSRDTQMSSLPRPKSNVNTSSSEFLGGVPQFATSSVPRPQNLYDGPLSVRNFK